MKFMFQKDVFLAWFIVQKQDMHGNSFELDHIPMHPLKYDRKRRIENSEEFVSWQTDIDLYMGNELQQYWKQFLRQKE